jgi:hypothetical protein
LTREELATNLAEIITAAKANPHNEAYAAIMSIEFAESLLSALTPDGAAGPVAEVSLGYFNATERRHVQKILTDEPLPLGTTLYAHPPARAQEWIAVGERLPEVKKGRVEQLWVCAERKHNGKRYVFTHEYANLPDEEGADWMLDGPDGDLVPLVGWCKKGIDSAGDEFYMPDDQDGEIIAWMPMEKPAPPTGSQNTGGER